MIPHGNAACIQVRPHPSPQRKQGKYGWPLWKWTADSSRLRFGLAWETAPLATLIVHAEQAKQSCP
jgi:hypothetical protein